MALQQCNCLRDDAYASSSQLLQDSEPAEANVPPMPDHPDYYGHGYKAQPRLESSANDAEDASTQSAAEQAETIGIWDDGQSDTDSSESSTEDNQESLPLLPPPRVAMEPVKVSGSFLAEISVKSPRQLFIFII